MDSITLLSRALDAAIDHIAESSECPGSLGFMDNPINCEDECTDGVVFERCWRRYFIAVAEKGGKS